jgi:hypothetical protein
MHFEILVEDKSGEEALKILVPKIIGSEHTFKIHSYTGIGHIPRGLHVNNAKTKTLLNNLPSLINGYAQSWQNYQAVLFVVCDLDDKNLMDFRNELLNVLNYCQNKPQTEFCIAIEEGEAWLLGDFEAIKQAYRHAREQVYSSYQNDSICGTWEKLADMIYKGGAVALKKKGYQEIGKLKSEWAREISPYMNVDANNSPSFIYFRDKLRKYI